MNCQEAIDLMEEAVEGRLPPRLLPGFEGHVTVCAACGTYLEHLRHTREALGNVRAKGRTSPHKQALLARFREEFGDTPKRR